MLQKFGATNFKPNEYKRKAKWHKKRIIFLATFLEWIL
jgi:hypothetical protein